MAKKQTLLSYSSAIKNFFVVFLFLVFFKPVQANAATWYVATTGSNSVSCGSSSSPCQTVNYALANKVRASDTIYMSPGTYTPEIISFSGVNHIGVTLTAQDQNNPPLIAGAAPNSARINIEADNVKVSHIRLRGASAPWGTGFDDALVNISGTGVVVDHCEFFNGGNGVRLLTLRGVTISNCDIHDGGAGYWPRCGGVDHHGIAVYNWSSASPATSWQEGILIDNNKIHGWEGDGMQELGQYDAHSIPTQYVTQLNNEIYNNCEQGLDYKGTRNVKIIGNNIYENGYGGIGTNDSDGSVNYSHVNWWVYNNTIHDHDNYGLMSQERDDGNWWVWNNIFYNNCKNPEYRYYTIQQLPPNSVFVHNVLWNNNSSGYETGGFIAEWSTNTVVKNNIFYNNGLGHYGNISSYTNAVVLYNYIYPASPGITGSSVIAVPNPLFSNLVAPSYDFHLQSSSPAKDKGIPITGDVNFTINTDKDGFTRPQGFSWDLGAYETEGGSPASPADLSVW